VSYLDLEGSHEDGQPEELFLFTNAEESFAYTDGPLPITAGAHTYSPTPIARTNIDLRDVESNRNLTVKVPIDNAFALRYVVTVPASIDSFQLFRQHSTDTPTPGIKQYFFGKVTGVKFKGNEALIDVKNFGSILERLVPQQTSRNACNHILYDAKCAVSDTSFKITGDVTAISTDGLTVTLDTGANTVPDTGLALSAQLTDDANFFIGGFIRRGGIEHRMVRDMTDLGGNVAEVVVLFPLQTISVGTTLEMFAGCDHQFPTCTDKFVNTPNYGGFPFVPLKNPFDVGVKGD
jgi:hypothetical protein